MEGFEKSIEKKYTKEQKELEELIERAMKMPGVAEIIEIFKETEKIVKQAPARPRRKMYTVITSDHS